jgi:hypothetical protein
MTPLTTSLDWADLHDRIMLDLNRLPYNADLRKMVYNITHMVNKLSSAEVLARQHGNRGSYQIACKDGARQINEAIANLQEWITLATLMS